MKTGLVILISPQRNSFCFKNSGSAPLTSCFQVKEKTNQDTRIVPLISICSGHIVKAPFPSAVVKSPPHSMKCCDWPQILSVSGNRFAQERGQTDLLGYSELTDHSGSQATFTYFMLRKHQKNARFLHPELNCFKVNVTSQNLSYA